MSFLLLLTGGALLADDEIKQKEGTVEQLTKDLLPLTTAVTIQGSSARVWLAGTLMARGATFIGQLPPASRHFEFGSTSVSGYLVDSGGGALGCGYYVKVQGNGDFHAQADLAQFAGSWTAATQLGLSGVVTAQVNAVLQWHVKGPACPFTGCSCQLGGGFGGTVGVGGSKGAPFAGHVTLGLAPDGTVSYSVFLDSPTHLEATATATLTWPGGSLGVGVPLPFDPPTGKLLSGALPLALAQDGDLTFGDGVKKHYKLTVTPKQPVADSNGIALLADIGLVWPAP